MSEYGKNKGATMLNPGDQVYVWGSGDYQNGFTGETVVAGKYSIPVCFLPSALGVQPQCSVQLQFLDKTTGLPSAPGTFEVDVLVSDNETPIGSYIKDSSPAFVINSVDATNQNARTELVVNARFLLLFMKTLTNAVNVIATVSK